MFTKLTWTFRIVLVAALGALPLGVCPCGTSQSDALQETSPAMSMTMGESDGHSCCIAKTPTEQTPASHCPTDRSGHDRDACPHCAGDLLTATCGDRLELPNTVVDNHVPGLTPPTSVSLPMFALSPAALAPCQKPLSTFTGDTLRALTCLSTT